MGGALAFVPDITLTAHHHGQGLNFENLGRLLASLVLGTPAFSAAMVPALFLLGAAAAYGAVNAARDSGPRRAFLVMAVLPTLALAYLAFAHDYPILSCHMPVFHMLAMALLAVPLSRVFIAVRMPAALAVAVAALAAGLQLGVERNLPGPGVMPPGRQLVCALREISRRHLSPGEAIVGEVARPHLGPEAANSFHVLQAAVYPAVFLPDCEDISSCGPDGAGVRSQPSLFRLPAAELKRRLAQRQARLLLVRSPEVFGKLAPDWRLAGRLGPNHFFLRTRDPLRPGFEVHLQAWQGGRVRPREFRAGAALPNPSENDG